MTPPMDELSLYRQFLWARQLRSVYREQHAAHERLFALAHAGTVGSYEQGYQPDMYMCLWYGVLFVVSEGFAALGLHDARIVGLLAKPEKALLRRFRNAVFHPSSYKDRRLEEMFAAGASSRAWVDSLTDAFNSYFAPLEAIDRAQRVNPVGGAT
jgi:hypothetical protein